MSENARVYAIDDDEAVLKSLESFLTHRGIPVETFASAASFLSQVSLAAPGCLILDIQMPGLNGLELQEQLTAANSPLSIVVVTGVADVPLAVKVMERGAFTLLEKPYDQNELVKAVRAALQLSTERWQKASAAQAVHERLATLNDEEAQVLSGMLSGDPNKTIASELHMSMRTVDRRRQTVLEKMGAKSVPELALMLGAAGAMKPNDPSEPSSPQAAE
jgi:two-component system response regulator FixJ